MYLRVCLVNPELITIALTLDAMINSNALHSYRRLGGIVVFDPRQAGALPIEHSKHATHVAKASIEEKGSLSISPVHDIKYQDPDLRPAHSLIQDGSIAFRPIDDSIDRHPLMERQRPSEIFWEIARVMRHPFTDIYSFAISSAVAVSILHLIRILIEQVREVYVKQPPLSRFEMKIRDMKVSFEDRRKKPIPWDSVENVLRNLAENVDQMFIGISRKIFRRDDIYSSGDITTAEKFVFFAVSMGTVLLLFYGMDVDERGNFVG